MDYRLAAARRLLTVDHMNERACSVISEYRPVFQFPDPLPAGSDPTMAGIAAGAGGRIGLLTVQADDGNFVRLATAWPCAPSADSRKTWRFVTAGHVLPCFLKDEIALDMAALSAVTMRAGQVVLPDRTLKIARWICAAKLDVAVFDVEQDGAACDGLVLAPPDDQMPAMVMPMGYPLAPPAQLFTSINPHFPGRLFYGEGNWRPKDSGELPSFHFQHDASTLPGYSGAPVLDPGTGRVIGVHVGGAESRRDWNDAVRVAPMLRALPWLRDVLTSARDDAPADAASIMWFGGMPPVAAECLRPDLTTPPRDGGVVEDRPDTRDRIYEPGLATAQDSILPPPGMIGDQGGEGACVAFALAAAIEHQLARRKGYTPADPGHFAVSVRMLDRMARRYDEWLDDAADGTSLRAAIKGFYHNGVCPWADCAYQPRQPAFFLTRDIARKARLTTLGSYARVRRSVNEMRMAVQEAGAVIVTARIHSGWKAPVDGVIAYDPLNPATGTALHAFIVDGYTEQGFVIQNSRGAGWSSFANRPGHALWSFDDWSDNCLDAWVIRLAPRSEAAFAVSIQSGKDGLAPPRRIGLLGHMMQAERGGLDEDGTLGLGARGVAETAAYLAGDEARARYDRLLLVFHEPLLDADQVARLALPLTARLKAQRTYAFHIAYGLDEMRSCRMRLHHDMAEAAARYMAENGSRDAALLRLLGPWLRAQVADYRRGARLAARGALRDALAVLPLFAGPNADGKGLQLALLSVGLGAIPAQALTEAVPEFRGLPHLALAAPVAVRGAKPWLLAESQRAQGDLPGWRGSWADLVAETHDRSVRSKSGAPAATAQDLLARADSPAALLARLPRPAA